MPAFARNGWKYRKRTVSGKKADDRVLARQADSIESAFCAEPGANVPDSKTFDHFLGGHLNSRGAPQFATPANQQSTLYVDAVVELAVAMARITPAPDRRLE